MFKKFLFSVALVMAMFSVNAQFRKIPSEVTDAFKAKYANATSVSWRDKLSSFQADFKIDDKDMKSVFSSKGEWLRTEVKYNSEHLPVAVQDGFKKSKYAELPIQEVTQIEEKEKGTLYRVVVKKNDVLKKNLVFTKEGQLISDSGTI